MQAVVAVTLVVKSRSRSSRRRGPPCGTDTLYTQRCFYMNSCQVMKESNGTISHFHVHNTFKTQL